MSETWPPGAVFDWDRIVREEAVYQQQKRERMERYATVVKTQLALFDVTSAQGTLKQ